MKKIWDVDPDGESWLGSLENPDLVLFNPPRRRRRNRKGRMPAGLARYWRSKRARKTFSHSRRRRSAPRRYRGSRRAHALRNPPATFFSGAVSRTRRRASGFVTQFPGIKQIAGVAIGFLAPPMVWAQVKRFLPVSIQSLPVDASDTSKSAIGYWAARAAVSAGPPLLIRKFIDKAMGNLMLIGGLVAFGVDLLKYYAPSFMSGQPMLGYYTPGPVSPAGGGFLPEAGPVRRSVGMGMYSAEGGPIYPPSRGQRPIIGSVASRLDPNNRF